MVPRDRRELPKDFGRYVGEFVLTYLPIMIMMYQQQYIMVVVQFYVHTMYIYTIVCNMTVSFDDIYTDSETI